MSAAKMLTGFTVPLLRQEKWTVNFVNAGTCDENVDLAGVKIVNGRDCVENVECADGAVKKEEIKDLGRKC